MKKIKLLIPVLASVSLASMTTIVSCQSDDDDDDIQIVVDQWMGGSEWIQSEPTNLESDQSCDYTIDMTKWLGGTATEHPENYPYFELKLDSGMPMNYLRIKQDSLTMFIDGKKVTSQDWQYVKDSFRFSNDQIRDKIMKSKTITGNFTLESTIGEKVGSTLKVVWYSPYIQPKP